MHTPNPVPSPSRTEGISTLCNQSSVTIVEYEDWNPDLAMMEKVKVMLGGCRRGKSMPEVREEQ